MSLVSITDGDGVRLLTWNRPDALNAMNDELWDATRDALLGAQADPDLRCVVVTGTGRAFTTGQDLNEMLAPVDHGDDELHGYRGLIGVLEEFDKPLLAAVNGLGVGFGATLLPYCDIVWMAESARLKVPFLPLGVTTEAAGSLLLPQRMGWQAASHFIFTAGWLSAPDAVASGLAWKVVPD
ncbi:MAG: enoyl-CoA hydratase/isomerase family protein, partial [Actinomycetota bacterium]|nr:enoyl-CoA hydratase/isomerase family protein [Actinomycetota bacterium]